MRTLIRISVVAWITTALFSTAPAQAVTTVDQIRGCQHRIYAHNRNFARYLAGKVEACTTRVRDCKLASEIDGAQLEPCLTRAEFYCGIAAEKVATQMASRKAAVDAYCGGFPLAALLQLTESLGFRALAATCGATTVPELTTCLFDGMRCRAERDIFRVDPRASDSLGAAGIAASFPCVGP